MEKIIEDLKKNPLIAVVAIPDPHLAVPLAKALLQGGVNCIEITFRNENAAEALHNIRDASLSIFVGAGTVRTHEDARKAIEAKTDFMVSPGLNESVIKYVQDNSEIPFFPGVDSTLGIEKAYNLGLKTLKFFPASVAGGPNWLKSVKGPYYDINFIPTGGVALANLEEYLSLPNVIACGGSFLARSHLIEDEKWDDITHTAKKAMKIVKKVK
ncbi:MAG: bifunctional 4-hydroxy-2-oxoglutarate aldolase/2-dehydro-3-deoxy-phosphogluconate aldolase [Promethearchaeia archaeon]